MNSINKDKSVRVAFDSFVNIGYGKSRSLYGWQTTRLAIETSLGVWFDDVQIRQSVVDGSPAELEKFLANLPDSNKCDLSIVYLGSIQDTEANWEFVDGQYRNWQDILNKVKIPINSNRIVIFDSCHSESICRTSAGSGVLGALILLASDIDEKTYQFEPSALRPIDVKKVCPWAWQWAQTYLPQNWSSHISFLGLVWIDTAAKIKSPPNEISQWRQFFDECAVNATSVRKTIADHWCSTISHRSF